MTVKKAVITAAGPDQASLPSQRLIDIDGQEKPVLRVLIEQALTAHIEEVCVIVAPGDESRYAQILGKAAPVRFVSQTKPLGYGYAVYCAREFVGNEPFLHLVGDHLYVNTGAIGAAQQILSLAEAESSAVSAVTPIRESLLPFYGAVGARRDSTRSTVYRVDTVLEKPTPTAAEQKIIVPGLRAGHYLCFFGMHVLTPPVFDILEQLHKDAPEQKLTLSTALNQLAKREQYLALEVADRRYDIGARYGLLTTQLALGLSGRDRDEVLARVLELLADREISHAAGSRA